MQERQTGKEAAPGTIYVHMLGAMEVYYNGKVLNLGISYSGKLIQLFLILIWAGEDGISRGRLQDYLYDRTTTNASNALRMLCSRLRRVIQASALPPGDYILTSNGNYCFGGTNLKFETDLGLLEQYFREVQKTGNREQKKNLLAKVCGLYQGELLPAMSGELWVEIMRSSAETMYIGCVRELCALLNEQGSYDQVRELLAAALKRCPMGDWEELLEENRRRIGSAETWIEILTSREERESGASACSYSEFKARFQATLRRAQHRQFPAMLYCCRLAPSPEREADVPEQEEAWKTLCAVLETSLRRSDLYTYCDRQILILSGGLNEREGERVRQRILNRFHEENKTRLILRITGKNLS